MSEQPYEVPKKRKYTRRNPALKGDVTNREILEAVLNLTEAIKGAFTAKLPVTAATLPEGNEPIVLKPVENLDKNSPNPVPFEYREIVNTLLNKNFGIEVRYVPEQNAMEFSILVPRNYSNASPTHWETFKEDRRMKVISNALGANGVREYVVQVYNNLPAETQSAITYDRSAL